MKHYKILVVAPFKNPWQECPNWDYITGAFESSGHQITRLNEGDTSADSVLDELEKGYDFILTEEARLWGDYTNLGQRDDFLLLFKPVMEKAKIPVVAWLNNIYWGLMRREDHIKYNPIFKADIVFSSDCGHQKEFEAAGVNHRCLRMGIYEPEAYISTQKYPTQAEIGFIGSVYPHMWPYRKELVDFLKKTYGIKFEHFGQNGEIRHDKLNSLVGTLKIVVGDSVFSPNYWSNRIYEVMGRGGFLITQMIPGLEKEFTPYKHFIPYKHGDFQNLKRCIDYYLEHDEEREKIRMAGFKYCRKVHSYRNRVKKLLATLEQEKII